MNKFTRNLLIGYIFILLLGVGNFGVIFFSFLNSVNAIVTTTSVVSLVLLAAYLALAFSHYNWEHATDVRDTKHYFTSLIILSIATGVLAVLYFIFHDSISSFFTKDYKALRSIITVAFGIAMSFILFVLYRNRKKPRQ